MSGKNFQRKIHRILDSPVLSNRISLSLSLYCFVYFSSSASVCRCSVVLKSRVNAMPACPVISGRSEASN